MGRALFLLGLLLSTSWCFSQKVVEKTLLNPQTRYIAIDSENCYKVELVTADTQALRIEAAIEGEYQNDLAVKLEEDGPNIKVSASFLPNFVAPNDKLSAHKVISIALRILVPLHSNVSVYGTTSDLTASGTFNTLNVLLSDGNCRLTDVRGAVIVKTAQGHISVSAESGNFDTHSDYGTTSFDSIPQGPSTFRLNSIQGNISVTRTE
ncbi:MAG: hypothetical protein HRT65_07485 [Flavobacteriaceae bacterium]|nr:hypothetical protein [Flavobacteriaceae bacterium]